jgi:hypothetical protein
MTKSTMAAAAALLAVPGVQSHICSYYPAQRGDVLPVDMGPGEDLCYRRTPYCGGVALPAAAPAQNVFVAGAPATLLFQQNLNHFWEKFPGSLDVSVSYDLNPTDSSWQVLLTLDDFAGNDMVTQTNFTPTVLIPATPSAHAIMRFRYVSHNLGEVDPANNTDSIFYNCADVRIISTEQAEAEGNVPPADNNAQPTKQQLDAEDVDQADDEIDGRASYCETPSSWSSSGIQTFADGRTVKREYFYDAAKKVVLVGAWLAEGGRKRLRWRRRRRMLFPCPNNHAGVDELACTVPHELLPSWSFPDVFLCACGASTHTFWLVHAVSIVATLLIGCTHRPQHRRVITVHVHVLQRDHPWSTKHHHARVPGHRHRHGARAFLQVLLLLWQCPRCTAFLSPGRWRRRRATHSVGWASHLSPRRCGRWPVLSTFVFVTFFVWSNASLRRVGYVVPRCAH